MSTAAHHMRPYAEGALTLQAAGWDPIPVKGKSAPPKGFTGREGAYPSRADVQAWLDGPEAGHNVAIRLRSDVIGIDVDAHSGKDGASTMAALVSRWGPLPPTWRSTSRDDGVSGVYLYRVPPGTDLSRAESIIGSIGPHIEVVRWDYRYVMAAPSIHPDTRAVYRWHAPDGAVSTIPPRLGDLP